MGYFGNSPSGHPVHRPFQRESQGKTLRGKGKGKPGKEKTKQNYIIRIYRFEKGNPRRLIGIVESVEGEKREKRAFTNLEDLWEILNSQASGTFPPKPDGSWSPGIGGSGDLFGK
jgi:hypothetical protein